MRIEKCTFEKKYSEKKSPIFCLKSCNFCNQNTPL